MNYKNSLKIGKYNYLISRSYSTAQQVKQDSKKKIADLKSFDEIPGPKPYPVLGNFLRFMPITGEYYSEDVLTLLRRLQKDFGNIVKISDLIGQRPMVHLYDPKDAELVYRSEEVMPQREIFPTMCYFRDNYRQDIFKNAKGIATSNGKEWAEFRSRVNHVMLQPKTVQSYTKVIEDISDEFIGRLRRTRAEGGEFFNDNIAIEMNKWSLETIAFIALEVKLNCMSDVADKTSVQYQLMQNIQQIFAFVSKLDFRASVWRYLPSPTFMQAMKTYDRQIDLSIGFIDKAMVKIKSNQADSQGLSVLGKLLKIDKNTALVMALDMLLAGVDTVSSNLKTACYYLSVNEDKQQKLRDEILNALSENGGELNSKSLNRMSYLRACLKEIQRIYPVSPGVLRELTKDTEIGGYIIPKGTNVFIPHMYYTMMEEEFPRPDEFIPERWLRKNVDDEISYKRAHPFSFLPFGFGARSCIGRRFAELEVQIVLVNVLKNFRISWRGPAPKKIMYAFNHLEKPFHFIFTDL